MVNDYNTPVWNILLYFCAVILTNIQHVIARGEMWSVQRTGHKWGKLQETDSYVCWWLEILIRFWNLATHNCILHCTIKQRGANSPSNNSTKPSEYLSEGQLFRPWKKCPGISEWANSSGAGQHMHSARTTKQTKYEEVFCIRIVPAMQESSMVG